jgi:glycosyltransferase involved in cell wall biosynthesis
MQTAIAPEPSLEAAHARRRDARCPTVDVVIPVLNEVATIEQSVLRVREYLAATTTFCGRVIIVDNGSSDGTLAVAAALGDAFADVSVLHLGERGRGRALRSAWLRSTADVVAYMDVDLSTDLGALEPLVTLVTSGSADVAIGSRLVGGSRVRRGPRREVISRCYNALLRRTLRVGFHDAQCGFKALRSEVARALLPLVEDNAWFFDTELLVRAERDGYRVVELPVAWTDDPDSRVAIFRTAWRDLRGIARLRAEGAGSTGRRSRHPVADGSPVAHRPGSQTNAA